MHTLSKSFLFKVSNSVLPEREIREIFKNIFISVRAYRSNIFCPTYTGDLTAHYLIFYSSHDEFVNQHQPIHTKNITYEKYGIDLFQFCPRFPGGPNRESMPESSVCKYPNDVYVLYFNLSQVTKYKNTRFNLQPVKIIWYVNDYHSQQ